MTAKIQKRKSRHEGPKFNKESKKPFKSTKTKKFNNEASAVEALEVGDDVADFPRGGSSALSKKERQEIEAEVDAEFAKKDYNNKKKRVDKKKKRSDTAADDDLGSLFGDSLTGKELRFSNRITLKNISPGMKLLGVVSEENEKDLVIGLPGGLRGLVRAGDAFDPVSGAEIEDSDGHHLTGFRVGQLVPCIVLALDDDKKEKGRRKIWLSLRLSLLHKGFTLDSIQEGMVLSAYVKSIEDHGYMLHFGLPSFTGFLPISDKAEDSAVKVKEGHLVKGMVKSVDKTRRLVYLSSDPDTISKCVTKDLKGISMDLLFPGMMVNARVKSILQNGIMLSFLTYFTGTVDMYHLQSSFPSSKWKDAYDVNKKVNTRILFIDPSSRAIGLTLNHHLVHDIAPPLHVKVGDIYDESKVVRIDRGFGLLLEIPSTPSPTPAYVSVADVAEEEIKKLEKKFKEGSQVRVRVLGFKRMEGLATGMLKASAFEGPVFTHSDVKPGMVVTAKVVTVDIFGAIVQFPGGVKALCPLSHMSELEISKPPKKFKIGADLVFRILGCKSKRLTVTHKKTLVKSKHPIVSSYTEATEGMITHGWIMKIENHGCFVRFYNGVQGFAPRFELGLEPGCDPSSMYHVGEVVKCRITSSVLATRRINLSFMMKPRRVSEDEEVKLGGLVSGVVEEITPDFVVVCVYGKGYLKGTISTEHLADHHEHAALMKSALQRGYKFDKLLVLDIEPSNTFLSAKYSLINRAQDLPSDLSQISPNTVVPGYVCNIIDNGIFVRFLGRLTGFSPRKKATDGPKTDLAKAFYVGQSVRSNIVDVNREKSRITLSLKQSCCSSTDSSFVEEYFIMDEKIAGLQNSIDSKWVEKFNIGSVIEGKVQEIKDYGVVVGLEDDKLGIISHYQLGGATMKTGSVVHAVILDITKAENLVDLSVKPEFINKPKEESSIKKTGFYGFNILVMLGDYSQLYNNVYHSLLQKRKKQLSKDLEMHQTVNAVVEIVKENYLASIFLLLPSIALEFKFFLFIQFTEIQNMNIQVLSVPDHGYAIGYASISDYNTQKFPQKSYVTGQTLLVSVSVTVTALPSSSTLSRTLFLLKSIAEATDSSKRAKKSSLYDVGSIVQAEITEIKPLELRLNFGNGIRGRVSITEVNDDSDSENPLANFKIGQTVTATIVGKPNLADKKKGHQWELSLKPTMQTGLNDISGNLEEKFDFSIGQRVTGYVYKVDNEWAWLTVSRHVRAQLYVLDSASEPSQLQEFQQHFPVGKAVLGHVLTINEEKKMLRIVLHPLKPQANSNTADMADDLERKISKSDAIAHICDGDIVGGRISRILPGVGGLIVQIGPHMYGRVHFTELKDSWVPDPMSGFLEREFIKCKVLEISHSANGNAHVDLSLRLSPDSNADASCRRFEKIENLHPDMVVQGYIKNTMSKGCFIILSRKIEGRILLSNLSDGYVENPEKEFTIGKLVEGRVLSVEPLSNRVEITLKSTNSNGAAKSEINDFSRLIVGDIVSGIIKRVESFGLFVTIENTNTVGLCHVSELSDERVGNIETKYRAGEKVMAKILKVNEEKRRISLGMKESYLASHNETNSEDESDEDIIANTLPESGSLGFENIDIVHENGVDLVLAEAESRASVPALEVSLDDVDEENVVMPNENDDKAISHVNKKQDKKKAKEQREQEIRAAEERLLEKDAPRTADEFEKLVRVSPNSSFVWIKYMEFLDNMADSEKARAVAERALKTINFREENEKLNIWKAYFNLENKHGNPPQEAVTKVFQRALQYCDPKKVHLALFGMYERDDQNELADEVLKKMVKKFKKSCKVWLENVRLLLKQDQDIQPVIKRALLSLPRHKHMKFTTKTALLEFKCGSPDKGRSMFEVMLREFPKRADLWSVYLDQEIRLGDADIIRSLFERAISLSLPHKKMIFLFKKYLEYERVHGDKERMEYVMMRANEYKENAVYQKSQRAKEKGLAPGKVNHAEDKKGRKNFRKHDGVHPKSQPSKEKAPSWPWSSSDEESVASDESDDLVCPSYQGILLDQLGHETLDPVGKFCLQHYNDKHNASYEFVELVWAGLQLMPAHCEYHFTLKVKNPINCLVEVFQAKTILTNGTVGLGNLEYREVLDCKISDVPYVEISDDVPLGPVRIGMKMNLPCAILSVYIKRYMSLKDHSFVLVVHVPYEAA
ncbi:hypothetical protein ACFE04_021172 [Oxalis oulophora]